MNKNLKFIFVFSFCIIGFQANSQNEKRSFPLFSDIVKEAFDIDYELPDGFTDKKTLELRKTSDYYSTSFSLNSPVLQSNDNECVLMYQLPFYYAMFETTISDIVKGEIRNNLGLKNCCTCSDIADVEISDYATVLNKKESKEMFNADSVFFINMPLSQPYQNNFTHCITILAFNEKRPVIKLLCFFTDSSYINRLDYLDKLKGKILYSNEEWIYDKEKNDKIIRDYIDFVGDINFSNQ